MQKIVTIIGARPQFIKAAVLSHLLNQEYKEYLQEIVVHTGQHYDYAMNDVFFEEMHLPKPHYFLNINGLTHGAMTGQMLEQIEQILLSEKPDWVVVYGDTNSTLAGALAARKLNIRLVHVEAGLRSYNPSMPEEINRILIDNMSSVLCCPSSHAVENLRKEGFFDKNRNHTVLETGDIMKDAVLFYQQFSTKPEYFEVSEKFVLATLHRAENTDSRQNLTEIIRGLERIAEEIPVILPLHPRTHKQLLEWNILPKNILLIEPVSYLSMLWLLEHCQLVLTDSGGLQKEAYFLKKYCITLREETEWMELVEGGFNQLTGANANTIQATYTFFKDKKLDNQTAFLYGNGTCARQIVAFLLNKQSNNLTI
ncbi:MAG: hypothetical protein RLZZ292_838 [Bacteroidota bacterium]|jgi:UDP-GlcNAc3NAcA epimerase